MHMSCCLRVEERVHGVVEFGIVGGVARVGRAMMSAKAYCVMIVFGPRSSEVSVIHTV